MRIEVDSVSFRYPSGVQALEGIRMEIKAGEQLALVGENGAGKTTLAKHLNGLLKPQQGRVVVGGWDTREFSTARIATRVGYVFQNPDDQLFERRVRDEVAYGPRNLGWNPGRIESAVDKALRWVGLSDLGDTHPYDLHAAQRKLVAIAATLAMDPPIVILDEPTTGQDGRGLERIAGIVQGLRESGRTVILISHDLDFCAEVLDRIVLMAEGQVLEDGSTLEVLQQEHILAESAVEAPQLFRLAKRLDIPIRGGKVEDFVHTWADSRGLKERGN